MRNKEYGEPLKEKRWASPHEEIRYKKAALANLELPRTLAQWGTIDMVLKLEPAKSRILIYCKTVYEKELIGAMSAIAGACALEVRLLSTGECAGFRPLCEVLVGGSRLPLEKILDELVKLFSPLVAVQTNI